MATDKTKTQIILPSVPLNAIEILTRDRDEWKARCLAAEAARDNSEDFAGLQNVRLSDELQKLRAAAGRLVAALPRCQYRSPANRGCENPALFGHGDGVKHCAEHIRSIDTSLIIAAPLRALIALLPKA
jgi:hypothetical protein